MTDPVESMAELVRRVSKTLSFTILDIGARQVGEKDVFYRLLELFPGSRILAFDVSEDLGEEFNQSGMPGLEYHPVVLGDSDGRRKLFETQHPMCSSLYRPDEQFIGSIKDSTSPH